MRDMVEKKPENMKTNREHIHVTIILSIAVHNDAYFCVLIMDVPYAVAYYRFSFFAHQ